MKKQSKAVVENSPTKPPPTYVTQCTQCKKLFFEYLKVCEQCHYACYCSISCQKDDWPRHRKKCQKEAELYRSLDYAERKIRKIAGYLNRCYSEFIFNEQSTEPIIDRYIRRILIFKKRESNLRLCLQFSLLTLDFLRPAKDLLKDIFYGMILLVMKEKFWKQLYLNFCYPKLSLSIVFYTEIIGKKEEVSCIQFPFVLKTNWKDTYATAYVNYTNGTIRKETKDQKERSE